MMCSRTLESKIGSKFLNKLEDLGLKFILALGLYIFSLISLSLVPATGFLTDASIKWSLISYYTWIRILATIIATTFLPGFLFIQILLTLTHNDNYIRLSRSAEITLSILLSVLLTALSGAIVVSVLSNPYIWGEPATLILNSILLLTLLLYTTYRVRLLKSHKILSKRMNKKKDTDQLKLELKYKLVLLSLFTFVIIGSSLPLIRSPRLIGDMVFHHNETLKLLSRDFNNLQNYPWLFISYLGVVLTTAKSSSIVVYDALYVLNFLPILAYYSMVSSYLRFKQKLLPILATMFSMFLGFGSLYLLSAPIFSNEIFYSAIFVASKTYDVHDVRVLFVPDIVAPLWLIGIPSFFMLIYILNLERNESLLCGTLIFFLTTLDYLGHMAEVAIFILLCLFLTVFNKKTRLKADLISLSLLLGLSMSVLLDVVFPTRNYTFYANNLAVFIASLVGCVLMLMVNSINTQIEKILDSIRKLISLQPKLNMAIKFLPLLSYLLLFIMWVYNFSNINAFALVPAQGRLESIGYWYVPLYVLPVRFGITALITVVGIAYYGLVIIKEPEYTIFTSMIAVGLFMEQLMNYVKIYPAYRLSTLTLAGFATLSALVMARFMFSKKSNTGESVKTESPLRKLLIIFSISIGVWSTCVYFINNVLQFGG